ncbi:alpha/beta fold hydrolase [Sphingomonas jatrophae]|uniref:Pimeloyl-ACP methyl ester carboxylesterase n=1 Tax=Sphingomonas jatrophae TaxID=1166337 RepID=A0A1I6KYS3_9SPHN|nr:alpha/beta fold hydrolase [Sphingomonas jatrophae]SFR96361.1 Pimeloyl-ACP methyl ester carboxylesterase [Sphingomonas jatrophae]
MANSPTDLKSHRFTAPDGVGLAWHELGEGWPVMLIHGLFSNALTNWVRYGHAAAIAARGFRVIMPDLRAHGASDKPHDPALYPADVLTADQEALIAHLGLTDFDLGGYSLGGRTTTRLLVRGSRPRRAILAGMGLEGLLDLGSRVDHFRHVLRNPGTFERGSPEWMTEAFLKTTKGDPKALLPLLDSFAPTPMAALEALDTPMLVVTGVDDQDNGSAAALADVLRNARFAEVPGGHMSAVTRPELGQEMANFLGG